MKYLASIFFILILFSCHQKSPEPVNFNEVEIAIILDDSISIRAIDVTEEGELWFAANNGAYGSYSEEKGLIKETIIYDTITPYFRAVSTNGKDAFALSIANPALLYKLTPKPTLVYKEEHEKVFYDAMKFWNEKEGIAMGDPTDDCLSVIITRDGGNSWSKISCDKLPKVEEGEAAFAASNTNIEIVGDHTWIVSGGKRSRVFYSSDKGNSWEVYETPIVQGEGTQGIYSVDFYDENNGVVIGGDYTKPEINLANKAVTTDGGKTWNLMSDGSIPGYKSCIQYVPNSDRKKMVAIGFTGISVTNDGGNTWKELSKEGFYTLKFVNDSVAYAAGNRRIAKLIFRE
ncbi:oxidoreductase [Flavobacteriaceae bacterium R38]|nr:oxidoreductase [Flavobacteriaceae bacterium R38]